MERRILAAAIALLLFAAILCIKSSNAQPVGADTLTDGTLSKVEEPIQLWVADSSSSNPVPDTVYVHDATDGQYWRSKIDDGTGGYFFRCPSPGTAFSLSATQSALSGFSGGAGSVVKNGNTAPLPKIVHRAECVERFRTTLDSLLSILEGDPKKTVFATECRTNIENGTVHIPASASFSGIEPTAGDTLALFEPGGRCVGHGVWTESGAVLAAAVSGGVAEEYFPEWDLLQDGEPMAFEVFKREENRVFRVGATFASCDTVGVPVCKDENGAEAGAFFQVAALSFSPLS